MKNKIGSIRTAFALLLTAISSSVVAAPILWVDDDSGNLGRVDVATGNVTIVGNTVHVLKDIAFSPSGELFGSDGSNLYQINVTTAVTTTVGPMDADVNSLVFNADGTLYGANNSLYRIDPATGQTTFIGSGGGLYNSSGDLAFVGGNLYLSSVSPGFDSLFRLDVTTGIGTNIGPIGTGVVYGLATDNNRDLYGVSNTNIYRVNVATGAGTLVQSFFNKGLSSAWGTSFISEAAPPVPEPSEYMLMLVGVAALGLALRTHVR